MFEWRVEERRRENNQNILKISIFYEPSPSLLSLASSPFVPNISLGSREVHEVDGTEDM
jgi:hypothetical protein